MFANTKEERAEMNIVAILSELVTGLRIVLIRSKVAPLKKRDEHVNTISTIPLNLQRRDSRCGADRLRQHYHPISYWIYGTSLQ